MTTIKSVFASLLLYSLLNTAIASVEVELNSQAFTFDQNPRLANVLAPLAFEQNWYWPASKLYNLDSNQASQQRERLLSELRQYSDNSSSDALVSAVIKQIQSWRLADRVGVDIDYDLARISLEHNPKFGDGNYLLQLLNRPSDLLVFGATTQPGQIPYPENTCLETIVERVEKTSLADDDFVYVVSPDRTIRKLGVSYWHSKCDLIMPGSQIYIPLAESQFFPSTSALNRAIAELANHRVFN